LNRSCGNPIIDDANGRGFERDVEPDIILLLIHDFLRVALIPQRLAVFRQLSAITPCPDALDEIAGRSDLARLKSAACLANPKDAKRRAGL